MFNSCKDFDEVSISTKEILTPLSDTDAPFGLIKTETGIHGQQVQRLPFCLSGSLILSQQV